MKTKRVKSFLFAAVIAIESVAVGFVPVGAKSVSENTVSENTILEKTISETTVKNEIVPEKAVSDEPISGVDGDLSWEIDSNGHLTITGRGNYGDRANSLKGGWLAYADKIKSATVNVKGITDTSYMFYGCSNMASVDLTDLEVNSVGTMKYMFYGCCSLESLEAYGLNTAGVSDMEAMFSGCESLKTLEISSYDSQFNTSNVANMASMFAGCSSLKSLDVSKVDTNKVAYMSSMFKGCSSLDSLDISHFATANVTDMSDMFAGCNNLSQLNAPNHSTGVAMELPAVQDCFWKYQPSDEVVTAVTTGGIYVRESEGTDAKLSWKIDADGHLTINGAGDYTGERGSWLTFANKITSATVEVDAMTSTAYMFYGCSNMTRADLTGLETTGVWDMSFMFAGCSSLDSLDVSGFNTGKVTSMCNMFDGCSSLKALHVDKLDTSSVVDMSYMFNDCSGLTTLDISGFNTSKVTNMGCMFRGCSKLTSLNMSGLDTGSLEYMTSIFSLCTALTTLNAPENKSMVDMILPTTSGDYVWKYQPTGEIVTTITKAGAYIKEIKSEEAPDKKDPVTDNSGTSVKDEPKATVETKTVTGTDGSVTTTVKTMEPSGEITLEIASVSKDRKVETVVNMIIDASGQLQDASIEVIHVVKSTKMTVNLNELKALADQITLCNTEYVYPVGSRPYVSEKIDSLGDMYEKAQETVGVAQKKANVSIKVTAKSPSGQKKYSVAIKKTDLTKKKLVVYASDKKGNAVMVNNKKNKATVNKKNDLTLKITKKGDYQVQNTKDAKKTDKKIMKTVKPKKSNVTVKKGKSSSVKLSSKCNKDNISKITYTSNSSNVKVSKKGKITAKGSGSAKITATVTMKNGKKKKIKVNVKVA